MNPFPYKDVFLAVENRLIEAGYVDWLDRISKVIKTRGAFKCQAGMVEEFTVPTRRY